MRILGPKYVRRAHSWCVTIFSSASKNGVTQTQNWFTTEQEAAKFVEEKNEEANTIS